MMKHLSAKTQYNAVNIHKPEDRVGDWQTALRFLREGNQRYVENKGIARNTNSDDRQVLKDGQNPFAVVVTCSDSRVSPEIFFDQKLGDIFVIRNAGNIADQTALGSIEYAVEHLKTTLVAVVGHSGCGAVTGAFNGGEYPNNLQTIIDVISHSTEHSSDVDAAIHANIDSAVNIIKHNETVIETGAEVVGAYYNIESGEVFWIK